MTDKDKRKLVMKFIKERLKTGDYNKSKYNSVFPPYLNESVEPSDYKNWIVKMIYALELDSLLSSKGLWNFQDLRWNEVEVIDKDIYKWR